MRIPSSAVMDNIKTNCRCNRKFTHSSQVHKFSFISFSETEVVWHESLSAGPLAQFHKLGCFKTISLLFIDKSKNPQDIRHLLEL